jgi:hypothetical protein
LKNSLNLHSSQFHDFVTLDPGVLNQFDSSVQSRLGFFLCQ